MGRIVKGAVGSERATATATATEDVAAMIVAARAEANRERAAAKDAAIVLARKMAEKIVGRAVELDEGVMRQIAAQALAAAKPERDSVRLRVHSDDLAAFGAGRAEWLAEIGVQAEVRLVADDSVGRCGCIVETAVGRVDARLDTQLEALERAVRGIASQRT